MVTQVKAWTPDPSWAAWAEIRRLAAVGSAAPALLHGLRLWAAVCLALYVAFWLELDNAYWAGLAAAIVCQPSLGASLRKAWFYVIGTAFGAVAIVALTACFPQDRFGFLVGLALWSAACGFVSSMLRNFAAFAAALAGFTAAIVAGGELGATGGASEVVFMLALTRASEVCIGIVSAAIVLSWTDFGAASRRLAAELAAISADIAEWACGRVLAVRAGPRQIRVRLSATSPDVSPRSIASLTKRSESLRTCAFTCRYCRQPSVVCSRRFPAGGWRPFNLSDCRSMSAGVRRTRFNAISRKS